VPEAVTLFSNVVAGHLPRQPGLMKISLVSLLPRAFVGETNQGIGGNGPPRSPTPVPNSAGSEKTTRPDRLGSTRGLVSIGAQSRQKTPRGNARPDRVKSVVLHHQPAVSKRPTGPEEKMVASFAVSRVSNHNTRRRTVEVV
jgi:hypothetical protein